MESSTQMLKNGLKIVIEGFSGENRRREHERNIFEGCIKVFFFYLFSNFIKSIVKERSTLIINDVE